MPFRLSNAPAAFQQFINEIFGDLLDMYIVVYLDNILIYLNNLEDHRKYIEEVLRHLRTYQLYAFPAKYAFHKESIEFLGFILGPEGLAMDKHKVKVIRD